MNSTYVSVTKGKGLPASTYPAGSFVITNNAASSQRIQRVSVDLSSSLLPGIVFDPTGSAGDSVAKKFTPDSGVAVTGQSGHQFFNPLDPSDASGNTDGWRGLAIDFTNFDPGETFTFSADIDPASIKGSAQPGPQGSGSVSGLELAGSKITVEYADGSVATGELFAVAGSAGASQVVVKTPAAAEPGVSVINIGSGPATVNTAAQQVQITGPAGASVRLLVVEGGAFTDADVSPTAYPLGAYGANTAVKVTQYTTTLGASGSAAINIQLNKTPVTLDPGETGKPA